MHKQAEARPDFEYPDAKSFLSAVYLTAAPDTGGAVSDAMYMIRHLGRAHPDWIEEAVIELANASHRGVRIALADSLEYIEEQDPALADDSSASCARTSRALSETGLRSDARWIPAEDPTLRLITLAGGSRRREIGQEGEQAGGRVRKTSHKARHSDGDGSYPASRDFDIAPRGRGACRSCRSRRRRPTG